MLELAPVLAWALASEPGRGPVQVQEPAQALVLEQASGLEQAWAMHQDLWVVLAALDCPSSGHCRLTALLASGSASVPDQALVKAQVPGLEQVLAQAPGLVPGSVLETDLALASVPEWVQEWVQEQALVQVQVQVQA